MFNAYKKAGGEEEKGASIPLKDSSLVRRNGDTQSPVPEARFKDELQPYLKVCCDSSWLG